MDNEINPIELKVMLKQGIVNFTYEKNNGDMRVARGTTMLSEIPVDSHPKGRGKRGKNVSYFDLDKDAWRSVGTYAEIFI